MVAIPNLNGDVRLTSSLSPLNPSIVPVHYPPPMFKDLKLKLARVKVYSKLDCNPLTVTMTPKSQRQYMRLPMGATNSGAVFQKLITEALSDCLGCIVYQDGMLMYGSTQEEHNRNLEKVLAWLEEKDLHLQVNKCHFSVVPFLGHIFAGDRFSKSVHESAHGTLPNPCEVKIMPK